MQPSSAYKHAEHKRKYVLNRHPITALYLGCLCLSNIVTSISWLMNVYRVFGLSCVVVSSNRLVGVCVFVQNTLSFAQSFWYPLICLDTLKRTQIALTVLLCYLITLWKICHCTRIQCAPCEWEQTFTFNKQTSIMDKMFNYFELIANVTLKSWDILLKPILIPSKTSVIDVTLLQLTIKPRSSHVL